MAMAQQPMAGPKAVRLAWDRVASTRALLNSDAKKIKKQKKATRKTVSDQYKTKHMCIMLPVATALEWNSL
jgi:hypothetical protein